MFSLKYGKIIVLGLCLAAFCPDAVLAAGLPVLQARHPETINEGEPFLLQIDDPVTVEDLNLLWLDKSISLKGQGRRVELLLPVPLAARGELPLSLISSEGLRIYSTRIKVKPKEFEVQHLTVEPKFVTPPARESTRIKHEREKMQQIYAAFTPERYFRLPLVRPLPGVITGEFGIRRLFNGEPRSRHMGVDFRGAEGSEVKALTAGRVVMAAEHYYSGNTLIVDHGLGTYSVYMHLSAFRTQEGRFVRPGEVIALVGKTGRVTGPHLHLSFIVQGEPQTPEPFMQNFR
jgi:murein DD-endopeptidase MepM/ murein hydrolase activator NlpD